MEFNKFNKATNSYQRVFINVHCSQKYLKKIFEWKTNSREIANVINLHLLIVKKLIIAR